jgi:hypothetical protein
MLSRGQQWMQRISQLFERGIERYNVLPQAVRYSLLPFVIASMPLLVSSMFGSKLIMPLVALLAVMLLYFTTLETDKFMFQVSRVRAHVAITTPLCSFISLWGIALASVDRKGMMLGIVGPYCLLLLIACAPAYRWKEARVTRRIPTRVSFSVMGAVVVFASFVYI